MTIQRMDHAGMVVDDLAAATAFFVELGLELQGEGSVEGGWVRGGAGGGPGGVRDDGDPERPRMARADQVSRPVGPGRRPARAGEHPGICHLAFAVDDIDAAVAGLRAHGAELVGEVENYEDIYRLCYVRGPEGIIVELAERIG
jgi:catechol 2,3-dioxygenase-like lactoylglutathione lyase family enzyme